MTCTTLLRRTEVSRRVGLGRTSLYEMVRRGLFPAPLQIGAHAVAWKEADVEAWIATRAAGTRPTDSTTTTERTLS